MTSHLKSMGAKKISKALFLHLVRKSISEEAQFHKLGTNIIDEELINKAEEKSLVGICKF